MTTPCVTPVNLPLSSSLRSVYFGKPGAIVKLPALPDSRYPMTIGRGEVVHGLPGGGSTVTRRQGIKRTWSFAFSAMTADEADTILSFYAGSRGLGPFCVIDPVWRNQLGLNASTMSAPLGTDTIWNAATADTDPTIDTTIAPPVPGTAVLRWTTPVLNHYLFEGTQPGGVLTVNTAKAVPYLSDQPAAVTLWARTATATANVSLNALGVASTGAWDGTSLVSSGTVGLTTAWKRLTALVPSGTWAATMGYLSVALKALSTGGPNILVAAPQVEYGVTNSNDAWVTGLGVARVSLSTPDRMSAPTFWRRDQSLVAVEN